MTDQHRRAVIAGLRDLADFLQANPAVPSRTARYT